MSETERAIRAFTGPANAGLRRLIRRRLAGAHPASVLTLTRTVALDMLGRAILLDIWQAWQAEHPNQCRLQTADGCPIALVEQEGADLGRDCGRIWVYSGNMWTWYGGFEDESRRQELLALAQTMSAKEFDDWFMA